MKIHMDNKKNPSCVVIELELGKSCEAGLVAQALHNFINNVDENGTHFVWSGNYGLSKKIVKRIEEIQVYYYKVK